MTLCWTLQAPSQLSISKIGPESDPILRNLFEHYCHDMAEWFEIDTQADGSYSYDTSWIWEHGHDVYLAKVGGSLAGFAVAGSAPDWLGDPGRHDVHEFFIIRRYRRSGFGLKMAALVWNEHPGDWLVRVLEANAPAISFWRNAISTYSRAVYQEERRMVKERPWRFFSFASKAS